MLNTAYPDGKHLGNGNDKGRRRDILHSVFALLSMCVYMCLYVLSICVYMCLYVFISANFANGISVVF